MYLNVLAYALVGSTMLILLTIPIQKWAYLGQVWSAKSGVLFYRKCILIFVMVLYGVSLIVFGYVFHFTEMVPL
jgi:uncharacterized membrane protein YadS